MHWKHKAAIQNLVARLPSPVSHAAYYAIQRRFGGLRDIDPLPMLMAGIDIADRAAAQGRPIQAGTVLEIGTGRRLGLPMALWLCGASRIVTVDLQRYLKGQLVAEDLAKMARRRHEVEGAFGERARDPVFLDRIERLMTAERNLDGLLALTGTEYRAPADAARVDLPAGSVDFQVSYTVLEHVRPEAIVGLLAEARRLLSKRGLAVHVIDFSDHFAHADTSISAINFLQFSDRQWQRRAGNRYMYHNRLRIDDVLDLFAAGGLHVLSVDTQVDDSSRSELRDGFPLDERFRGKTEEVLATTHACIVGAFDAAGR